MNTTPLREYWNGHPVELGIAWTPSKRGHVAGAARTAPQDRSERALLPSRPGLNMLGTLIPLAVVIAGSSIILAFVALRACRR